MDRAERKPCRNAQVQGRMCPNTVPAASKSGRCRACYLADLGTTERKFEAEAQGAMLGRMIASAARRAQRDDPGKGLAMLLSIQAELAELVDDVGVAQVRERGQSQVAADLAFGTGEVWTRKRVDKRWGLASPAVARRQLN